MDEEPLANCVLYARRASLSQTGADKLRNDFQRLRKVQIVPLVTIVEAIGDLGSARRPGTRAGFNRIIREVKRGRIQGIVCLSAEALARNFDELSQLDELMNTGRLDFIATPKHFLVSPWVDKARD